MKDLLIIVVEERKTLLRGLLFSFVVILPFTFIPTLIEHGWVKEFLINRLYPSVGYALGFAALIVIAAVVQNYNNLRRRKRLFDRPAFTALNFYGRLDGVGSIVRELETFLLGEVGGYYYRLNLVDVDKPEHGLEIVPFIDLRGDMKMEKILIRALGFRRVYFFGLVVPLNEQVLNDRSFISAKLEELSSKFHELNVKPLEFAEADLDD